jgi:hypothetical protein
MSAMMPLMSLRNGGEEEDGDENSITVADSSKLNLSLTAAFPGTKEQALKENRILLFALIFFPLLVGVFLSVFLY